MSALPDIVAALERSRVLPVLTCDDPGQAEAACHALLAGGIPCVEITFRTDAAVAAIEAAEAISTNAHGAIVSYDLNFRPSLWKALGGTVQAARVNRELVENVDVLIGNEEDYAAALSYELESVDENLLDLDVGSYERLLERVVDDHPQLALAAVTLREARTATSNDWSAACRTRREFFAGPSLQALEIFDRVGGGDSFASGLVYGLLQGFDVSKALHFGVAHGALAMTTPGDTSMATLAEVERLVAGGSPRVVR